MKVQSTQFVTFWLSDQILPVYISFPWSQASSLRFITGIEVSIFQHVKYILPASQTRDTITISDTFKLTASTNPQCASISLTTSTVQGRFTSEKVRVFHTLLVVLHRRGFYERIMWQDSIEIFRHQNDGKSATSACWHSRTLIVTRYVVYFSNRYSISEHCSN